MIKIVQLLTVAPTPSPSPLDHGDKIRSMFDSPWTGPVIVALVIAIIALFSSKRSD